MKVIARIIAAILLLVGIIYMFMAFGTPGAYSTYSASAVQMTQIYAEAIYNAAIATMCFSLVLLLEFATSKQGSNLSKLSEQTEETNALLKRLGSVIARQQRS